MRRAHGFLLRFIDLGLLLLMAFLVVAELNPTHQESLPGNPGQPEAAEVSATYELMFDADFDLRLKSAANDRILCRATEMDVLVSCMKKQPPGRFVLTPDGRASVQQLVGLMDMCERQRLRCTIAHRV